MKVKVKSLSRVWLFATPQTVAHQAPPSMGFSSKSTGVGCHCLLQRQTLTDIKGKIDSNTIIVDLNTPLTPMDRSSNQKTNKETQVFTDTLDETDHIYIFRTFHPNAKECTFFSSAHGTLSRIDYILGHKSNLSKFKKIEIVSKHLLQPQHYEIRYQLQEKNCKKHKHM